MRIVKKEKAITVVYSRTKDPDITWRKVKEFCENQIKKIDSSKEAKEIEAIKITIKSLQHKVELFENNRNKYVIMSNSIHFDDDDIDIPLIKNKESENTYEN